MDVEIIIRYGKRRVSESGRVSWDSGSAIKSGVVTMAGNSFDDSGIVEVGEVARSLAANLVYAKES